MLIILYIPHKRIKITLDKESKFKMYFMIHFEQQLILKIMHANISYINVSLNNMLYLFMYI